MPTFSPTFMLAKADKNESSLLVPVSWAIKCEAADFGGDLKVFCSLAEFEDPLSNVSLSSSWSTSLKGTGVDSRSGWKKKLNFSWAHQMKSINTVGIWNLTIWNPQAGLCEGQISNGLAFKWLSFTYGYSPNQSKTGPFKIGTFLSGFQMVIWQNGCHLSGFQMVGLPDFRSHSKSRSFPTQPLLDHLKSRLGWISDIQSSKKFQA